MADSYSDVTKDTFNETVLGASQMVITLFTSPRSSSCQIQEPEFEVVSKEYQDRVLFTRINVDTEKDLKASNHVDGIPIMIFFKAGKEIYRLTGIMMREKLRRQIEGVLLASS